MAIQAIARPSAAELRSQRSNLVRSKMGASLGSIDEVDPEKITGGNFSFDIGLQRIGKANIATDLIILGPG